MVLSQELRQWAILMQRIKGITCPCSYCPLSSNVL